MRGRGLLPRSIGKDYLMTVTFQIEGGSPVTIACNAGENLLELARRANVAIDAP